MTLRNHMTFHRCFLRPSTVRRCQSWVPLPCSDHTATGWVVWKCFSHRSSNAIFLDRNWAIDFLRPRLSRGLGFTGSFSPDSTCTSLKRPACDWQIHLLASLGVHLLTNNYRIVFTVLPKRQKTITALLKVATLHPKPRFPVRTACWFSYRVFQITTSSFSERASPVLICGCAEKISNTCHCTEFESRHRNSAGCLGEVTSHITLLCQRSTPPPRGAGSLKCFRIHKG